MERSIAFTGGDFITAADLGMMDNANHGGGAQEALSLVEAEKQHIAQVFQKSGGDANEAARLLGLSRSTFYEKLKKHGIAPPSGRRS